jgi:hypothetical protein
VTTPEKIVEDIAALSKAVSMPLPNEAEALIEEASYRSQWMCRVAEMEADAQCMLDKRRGEVADKYADLSATLYRDKLASETADFSRLVMLCHRMYSTLEQQVILISVQISYHKSQREHAGRFEPH